MAALVLVIPDTVFTRALLDGSVAVDGFDVTFDPSGYSGPAASARLRGRIEEHFAGAEQVIPDYLVRLARGAGQPLVALPVFLTRGMVHRKYVGRRGGPAPGELNGGRIAVSRVLAATAVYLRAILADGYGLRRAGATWTAAESLSSDDALVGDWKLMGQRLEVKAPELLRLLAEGEVDAVLYPGGGGGNWYQWTGEGRAGGSTSHYGDLEALVAADPRLDLPLGAREMMQAWFSRTGVYPLFHMIALHRSVVDANPGLPEALTEAFRRAAERARGYLAIEDQRLYDREIELLGVDPNVPGLTPITARSVEYLLDALEADGVLARRPALDEIFPGTPRLTL